MDRFTHDVRGALRQWSHSPGFAIAFNAVSNRRDTNALARRAIKFYGG